jgi:hypothetical protein
MKIPFGQFLIKIKTLACLLVLGLTITGIIPQQVQVRAQLQPEKIDLEAINRIKEEESKHSQVMEMVGYLADVIGPRLTGSPNLKKAQQYAMDRMREWGIANAHPEAWSFGRGWSLEGFTANMVAPSFGSLIAYPKAWSPGTNGPVRGEVVLLDVKSVADLAKYQGKLKGRIALLTSARPVAPDFTPQAQRTTDEELLKLANAKPPVSTPGELQRFQMSPEQRARVELNYQKWQLIYAEGAAVVLEPGAGDGGVVYVTRVTIPSPIDMPSEQRPQPWNLNKPKVIPQVVVAAEQYNRMIRILGRGVPVEVEVNINARFHDDDPMSHNIIGEIPGSDLKDEVVMIGGHLDSWHTGVGATDNADGSTTVMEAMRILKAIGARPRRTIRVALWGGEEQGLLGSKAWVTEHLAGPANAAAREKFDVYYNIDNGTGKIYGWFLQNQEEVRPIFDSWLEPLKNLGARRNVGEPVGSTDHLSFTDAGVPGFNPIQDYGNYDIRTHHTNMDTDDRLDVNDIRQAAIVMATFAYQSAMTDRKLPRPAVK